MIHAVIVAAGEGKRALGAIKKQFALLSSRPMIVHTLTPFFASSIIDTVSCVIAKDEISYFVGESFFCDTPVIHISLIQSLEFYVLMYF